MFITVNGKKTQVIVDLTVSGFLAERNIAPEKVVIELNRAILKNSEWAKTILNENDKMEILSFVGGG